LLSAGLDKRNCKTYHATGDADLLNVQKAVQSATISKSVLVDEDTDFIVVLCYHANLDSHNFFFCLEPKKHEKICVWNIIATKEKLGEDICSNVLFIHIILGYDATSRFY